MRPLSTLAQSYRLGAFGPRIASTPSAPQDTYLLQRLGAIVQHSGVILLQHTGHTNNLLTMFVCRT